MRKFLKTNKNQNEMVYIYGSYQSITERVNDSSLKEKSILEGPYLRKWVSGGEWILISRSMHGKNSSQNTSNGGKITRIIIKSVKIATFLRE